MLQFSNGLGRSPGAGSCRGVAVLVDEGTGRCCLVRPGPLATSGEAGDRRLLAKSAAVGEPISGVTGTSCSLSTVSGLWNSVLVIGDKDNILNSSFGIARSCTDRVESSNVVIGERHDVSLRHAMISNVH